MEGSEFGGRFSDVQQVSVSGERMFLPSLVVPEDTLQRKRGEHIKDSESGEGG